MLNRNKSYTKVGIDIDCILEIRLNHEMWEKIVRVAEMKKKSYSWIVRYCVFRLIKRADAKAYILNWKSSKRRVNFEILEERVKKHCGDNLHRHKLCLYGDDEFLIRMTAGLMHYSMSHLVRLALEWNLDEIERISNAKPGRFHRLAFYWLGIKLYEDVKGVNFPTRGTVDLQYRLIRFNEADYW